MQLVKSTRKAGIIENLDYAELEYQKLSKLIWEAYGDNLPTPKYIAQTAGNILQTTRDCFDHLAKDLIEQVLLKNASETVKNKYQNGKFKSNFPFREGQLINLKDNIFSLSKDICPPLHAQLKNFIDAIDQNKCIVNTDLRVKILREMVEMVNDKKHSKILEYKRKENEKLFIKSETGSFLFDKDFRNDGSIRVLLPAETTPKLVPDYIFTYNGHEVMRFTSSVVHTAKMVMDIFYDAFFEEEEKVYKVNKVEIPKISHPTQEEIAQLMPGWSSKPLEI